MINIVSNEGIKSSLTSLKLGCLLCNVKNNEYNSELWKEIDSEVIRISSIDISNIKDIPQIASSREAYKRLGKDPSRYRLSSEALYRRIINQKGLYQINTVVDIINFSSLKTGYSIGGYDFDKINGEITLRKGTKDDIYDAIGRGILNIEDLPVFADYTGAFGSPTSDSVRTSITLQTKKVFLIVMNFGNHDYFIEDVELIQNLLQKYAYADNLCISIV
jgi:DNA/RNA-binding domain of Phe-tRNA-synthetase-like protein